MKKRAASLALVLSMILSFTCQAGAVDANSGDDGQQVSTYAALEASAQSGGLTKLGAVKYILLDCGMKTTQFPSGDSDYIAMAKSVGIADDKFDGSAACSLEELNTMANSTEAVNLRNAVKNGTPLFVDGVAQPIFPYTSGVPTEDGYSNDNSDIIRYSVYVETNYDTDGDGKLDLVKALVQLPRAAAEGKYKAAAIYDARPYITGCTDNGDDRKFTYKKDDLGYDLNSLYAQPNARQAEGEAGTMEAAAKAKADEWYYVSPYESGSWGDFYDYEDLDWYDYFLVRGYAVVEVGGLGTRGSEGLETCGADVETDAFKCVVEWLAKDSTRTAYTDKEKNIKITADWSNGNVAMTGRSYGGTTDFAVASTGVKASWYEYTNSQGISTSDNPAYSDNLGLYCAGRYIDEDDWNSIKDTYQAYLNRIYNDQVALNGDYGTHWATRDYTAGNTGKKTDNGLTYDNFSCPALIVHGLNDDNVRTKEFDLMYQAYQKAGVNVKLLLHQDAHLTPSYPAGNLEFYIDGESYNNVLNRWFSHYLCGVENGAENMAAVTAQSNVDASVWNTYDSWTTDESIALSNADDTGTTTINSDYATQGINRRNWRDALTAGSTDVSAMYTMDVDADTVIKGSVAVSFTASADNYDAPETTSPRGTVDHDNYVGEETNALDHDNYVGAASADGAVTVSLPDGADLIDRDALMVSAMLVDIAPEGTTFPAYNTQGSYVPKTITAGGAWMGGGLNNYDYAELNATDVSYKIIARGWMDLCNPGAGYDSASAGTKVALKVGENHDYTIYLQPNLYTVKEGHKLALVIYTYEPGKANYSQDYQITLENASVSAEIPVDKIPAVPALPFTDVPADTELYAAVKWAYFSAPQITVGVTETTFAPASTCTRAEVVTFLYRLAGEPDVSGTALPFTDVAEDAYYTDAVKWAAANGVTAGTSATTFSPNDTCTRAQAVTLLYNAAGAPAVSDTVSFADVAADAYYADAVAWAAANGVTAGTSATTFSPDDACTRGQIVCMLYRGDTQA